MPSKDIEKKNKVNLEYYYRNRERLKEKQRLKSLEDYKDPVKRGKKLAAQLKWRLTNPEVAILYRIKQRCKRENIPCDLEVDDIVIPDICPIFKKPLVIVAGRNDYAPSVDRINPKLGYIKGNIHIISDRANRIKNDSTPEELRLLADYFGTNLIQEKLTGDKK